MAGAAFTPAAAPGHVFRDATSGFESGQSMMQRASLFQQQKEMQQMQLKQAQQKLTQDIIMAPIEKARTEAELATYEVQLQSALDQQNFEKTLAGVVPQAEKEFNELMLIADPGARANAALAFSGKYAQLKNTKKWGQQFSAYDQIANTIYRENSAMEKLAAGGEIRREIETVKSGAKADLAKQAEENKLAIAELKAANKQGPAAQKMQEEVGTKAGQYYAAQQEKVSEHTRTIDTIKSNRTELEKGAEQGVGEASKIGVMQAINTVTRTAGLPELFDTSKREVLQRGYSDMSLAAAARMKNQGQITESERKLLQNTVASFGNSKKAALYIMDFMEAVAQREISKASFLKQKMEEGGYVDASVEPEFYEQNPLSFYMPVGGDEKPAAQSDKEASDIESRLAKYRKKPEGK